MSNKLTPFDIGIIMHPLGTDKRPPENRNHFAIGKQSKGQELKSLEKLEKLKLMTSRLDPLNENALIYHATDKAKKKIRYKGNL